MKLLHRAVSAVVEPSVRRLRTTTAFHSKPGLVFSVSIVSAFPLWKTGVSVFWSSWWCGFQFGPYQNTYLLFTSELTIMFVPRPEADWGAEEGRVVFSSEMYPLNSKCIFKNILPSEPFDWAQCCYVWSYWTGVTFGTHSGKCSPVAIPSSPMWHRLLISVENSYKP